MEPVHFDGGLGRGICGLDAATEPLTTDEEEATCRHCLARLAAFELCAVSRDIALSDASANIDWFGGA